MSFEFVTRQAVEALHAEQLRRHGGASGLRDENALESALSRPLNKAAYGSTDIHELAGAYAYGLAKNHAFVDGNKRIAVVTALVFLALNGYESTLNDGQLYLLGMGLASGEIDEAGAAACLRDHTVATPID